MVTKVNRSLFAALVLGLVVSAPVARAAEVSAPQSRYSNYECVNGLCVGMSVRVVGGQWAGHAGTIVSIDSYQDTLTVVNSRGIYLYPRLYDVTTTISQPSASGCTGNLCLGDQVRILVGMYRGRIGNIVDTDDYNFTATVLVDGRYVIEDIRDLTLVMRPSRPNPYPNHPRNCPYGYIYDVYRGCIRISYPYPRPYPHPRPYPVPHPRPYPRPRPYPHPHPAPAPQPNPPPRPRNPSPAPRPVPAPMPPHGGGHHR